MQQKLAVTFAILLSGCTTPAWSPPPPQMVPIGAAETVYQNPVLLQISDPECAWEAVVDVIDDYFKIEQEEPVRKIGGTITEGRIKTFPAVSPTLLEPWRRDSAGEYQKLENTLQTMRRYAVVRLLPADGGFWVDVAVFKELEDLPRPEQATAGGATFRYDSSFSRVENPNTGGQVAQDWIAHGRDSELEQRIIGHLLYNADELAANRSMP
jgi:hypothetical protein